MATNRKILVLIIKFAVPQDSECPLSPDAKTGNGGCRTF